MKVRQHFTWAFLLTLALLLGGWVRYSSTGTFVPIDDIMLYFPMVAKDSQTSTQGAIVVDHRHTDINQIPEYWIGQVKGLVVHYAHTSHGGQVLSGLRWLENRDSRYNVDILASGEVALPSDMTALRFYDGNNYPGDTYITPDQYWETSGGRDHSRSVADTGWFTSSLWTWCGQMSYYIESQIQLYMGTLAQFEDDYSDMRFIYYTGHTDGSTPGSGSALWRNNNMVRQYVDNNGKILFDFADIESYDPDGNFYPTVSDICEWCSGWCSAHPSNFECQSLPSCAHSHGLQCTLKGQAFWWLMARLAGWDGIPMP